MTRGWPTFSIAAPINRAASMTIAMTTNSAASVWPNSRCFSAATRSKPAAPGAPIVSVSPRLAACPAIAIARAAPLHVTSPVIAPSA